MNANDTRNEALRMLKEVLLSGSFISDAAKDAALPEKGASALDQRFILNLVRGTAERKTILEAILGKLVKTPAGKMKPLLRLILLQGLYELLFTNGKPYAVVNEYVRLAKRRGFQGLSGFANAVLRRAANEKESLLQSLGDEESSGLPEKVLEILSSYAGRENALRFGHFVMSDASKALTVRRNVSKCSEEVFLESLRSEGCDAFRQETGLLVTADNEDVLPQDEIYVLRAEKPIAQLETFRKGFFYVQDISAWSVFRTLSPVLRPETAALDLCAAPGGKTFHLMDMAAKKDICVRFTACDVSENRLSRLRENAERMGFTDLTVRKIDATEFRPEFADAFDLVIADVPCSGLGDLAGKPEIRFHVTDEELLQLSDIQKKILSRAASYVRPGGILQYSTCTLTDTENEGQIRRFLEEHPDYRLLEEKRLIPGVNTSGDGFYAARMRRGETKEAL